MQQAPAICWSYGRTLGNIAVFNQEILGSFPAKTGSDAILPCDFVHAGKFRHGADRWWCRTHQCHWGTKADLASFNSTKVMSCSNREQRMDYVVAPKQVNMNDFAEVGVWCSMPQAMSTKEIPKRPPRIHVHIRNAAGGDKKTDGDFPAISMLYSAKLGLFDNPEITRVNITPPAAFEFVRSLEIEREMDCINCSHCGYPHLDLGDFAVRPHRKHFCANCGRDSTWSKEPIISTPLKPLHDQFSKTYKFEEPDRTLNLDEHKGRDYDIWPSTPAILWTANRPQEKGIHVHVYEGKKRIVDDTFSEVVLDGKPLCRKELFERLVERTVI